MSDELEEIPTLSDEVFEGEEEAEPGHIALDDEGNPVEEDDDAEA